jgi:hypothetical protein
VTPRYKEVNSQLMAMTHFQARSRKSRGEKNNKKASITFVLSARPSVRPSCLSAIIGVTPIRQIFVKF